MATNKRRPRAGSHTPAAAGAPAPALGLLQTIIDFQTEEAIAVFDRSLRHIAVNDAWKASISGDAVIGRTIWEVFGPKDERFGRDIEAVLAGETVMRRVASADAWQVSQVRLSPWHDETGKIAGVITRHKVTTGKGLQARERRLRMAMETAEVVAFQVDFRTGMLTEEPSGRTTHNPGMTSLEALVASLPEQWRAPQREAGRRHLETGEPMREEYQTYGEGGGLVWRRSVAEAVRGVDGQVIGIVGLSQVIDRYKRAELALVAEKEAAQAADRAKSEFLANISHEIRTPLNGVLGLASLLSKTRLDTGQSEMVRTIEASARTLNALMCDVLDLAKIESGRLELDVQPFAPAETVQHIHRLFAAAAADKGLDFSCEVDPSVSGMAIGDHTRLNQILTNLISNAIKFTAAGQVSLGVRAEGEGCDQRLVFTVSDTGMGISREALPRLFARFVQADGSISRSFGGTGLGLAISRTLARLMDGDIEAASTPGQGSTFTVTVGAPRWVQDVDGAAGDVAAGGAGLPLDRALQVLLVEDHPVNRRVVELILDGLVSLECAENGALGLAAFRRQAFDIVLMDMQMPVMDGLEATRAIRDFERARGAGRTPIVMLSANALNEHVRSGLEAGADFHLAKPITADDLIQALARAAEIGQDAAAPLAATA
ncbi:ATP-binding protein [Phenylobacterium sp.]|uniref:ATP-binding protein n=1 Tax=Phenylobacterium sp. TaxID=1871053 RepID=UPI002F42DEE5